MKRGHTIRT